MSRIAELINKYEDERKQTITNMENVKKEMAKLNQIGMELTAKANMLTGKIEGLKELAQSEKSEVSKNEG
jgi:hypothetical protein